MRRIIKIIDLLCLISNGEAVPKKIRLNGCIFEYQGDDYKYIEDGKEYWLFSDEYPNKYEWLYNFLNAAADVIDDEDKDIPLIPDDELYIFKGDSKELNYNFKVLTEKINQVVKEFNEYRKENE